MTETPTRPYGQIPDPHEWARNREQPPFNRPDVPYSPPPPGHNSNNWYSDGPAVFPWMGKRPPQCAGHRMCETYLLAYIQELRRRHAEEWLKKDDDIRHLVALNATLAKQALAEPETKPTQKQASTCR